MIRTLEYTREWSFFDPTFTYQVTDLVQNRSLGSVARLAGERVWHASNVTWSGGGEVVATFPTRYAAAVALRFLADGVDPSTYGGYHPHPVQSVQDARPAAVS